MSQSTFAIFGAGKQGKRLKDLLERNSSDQFVGFIDDSIATSEREKIFNSQDAHSFVNPTRIFLPFYRVDSCAEQVASRAAAERMAKQFPKATLVQLPEDLDVLSARVVECCESFAVLIPNHINPDSDPGCEEQPFGMTTPSERKYYTQIAADAIGQPGSIVDLGCWLGSTSISLAQGIQHTNELVYAMDCFVWRNWMDPWAHEMLCSYLPGESFLPETRRRIENVQDNIQLLEVDLTTYEWEQGAIKILLVDAMKSWELTETIATEFYPSLAVGSSLIHQDFKFYAVPWIHLLQYRLRDAFELCADVTDSTTVGFRTKRLLSRDEVRAAATFEGVSDQEVADAMAYFASFLGEAGRASLAGAHMHYFTELGRKDQAEKICRQYESRYGTHKDFLPAKDHFSARFSG